MTPSMDTETLSEVMQVWAGTSSTISFRVRT